MLKLEFLSDPPHSESNSQEKGKLLKKKVIVQTIAEEGEFLSSVFLRVKIYGSYRMILNLKKSNKYIDSKHFKMESSQNFFSIWSSQGSGWLL